MKKSMKITISGFLLLMMFAALLSSCGAERVKIEDYEWKMRTIAHVENDKVVYDAAAEESSTHPEAKMIDMILVAKDGKIIITDITNNNTYEGTYTVSGKNPRGTDYKIMVDGKEGYATAAMTTYADGREEPTLPLMIGEYSLYFYERSH